MKRFLPILLGASLSLVVATSALAIERGGSMAFARYDDSAIIDPVWADRNPDLWLINALYETLLRNGPDGSIVAGLAESHDVSADGKTIKLTLRESLKFSDGSPLTGEDVVFSLERARNPDLGPWAGLLGSVESVKAEDNTITLSLKQPDPTILSILATFNTGIVSKAAFEKAAGATDRTAFLVIADHGMEQNDPENTASWTDALVASGVPHLDVEGFVYVDHAPTAR